MESQYNQNIFLPTDDVRRLSALQKDIEGQTGVEVFGLERSIELDPNVVETIVALSVAHFAAVGVYIHYGENSRDTPLETYYALLGLD